jgi:hypothetical protein
VDPIKLLIAIAAAALILRVGLGLLRGLARPLPEPPPAGELRKVKIRYRCSLCGTEVRMTAATNEEPEAPRHCMEDMDLIASSDL